MTWDEVSAGAEGQELVFTTDEVLRACDEHGDLFADVLTVCRSCRPRLGLEDVAHVAEPDGMRAA